MKLITKIGPKDELCYDTRKLCRRRRHCIRCILTSRIFFGYSTGRIHLPSSPKAVHWMRKESHTSTPSDLCMFQDILGKCSWVL